MTKQHKAALYYSQKLKWSVIPIKLSRNGNKIDKKPLVIWGEFQNRIASEEEINNWFSEYPNAQIGIITGKISNLLVLDVDKGGDISWLEIPPTAEANTISGGKHYFFTFPDKEFRNSAGVLGKNLDIRANGGFVVIAPSEFEKMKYEWVHNPVESKISGVPALLSEKLLDKKINPVVPIATLLSGVEDGYRNFSAASLIGHLLIKYDPQDWESICWPLFIGWNRINSPPLDEKTLRTTFNSIASIEMRRRQGEVIEDDLLNYDGEDRIVLSTEMKNIVDSQEDTPSINSKIPTLDKLTQGFREGEVIIISGAKKNGKTTLLRTLTKNFYEQKIMPTWFSFEMTPKELIKSFGFELPIFSMPLRLEDKNLNWIKKRCVEAKLKQGGKIVFIDHLHYLFDMATTRNTSLEIGSIVRFLKRLAIEENLIIFLVCHTTKNSTEELEDSDLRDSGMIAAEADSTIMVRRIPTKQIDGSKIYQNEAEIKVCNHRFTGVMKESFKVRLLENYLIEQSYD